MSKLVSIIIPVYNSELTICKCIESVLSQTYNLKEVIVVDDGSTDNSYNIIKRKYPEVITYKTTHSGSPSKVRNFGINMAKGEYISFLDSDDYWDRNVIEKLMYKMMFYTDIALCYGDLIYNSGEFNGKKVHDFRTPHSGFVFEKLLIKNFIPMHPAVVKKEALVKTGGFDESMGLKVSEDYDLWLRITYHYKVGYEPEAIGYYSIKENGRFNTTNVLERNIDTLKVIMKIKKLFNLKSKPVYKKILVLNITIMKNLFAGKKTISIIYYLFCSLKYLLLYFTVRRNRENTFYNSRFPS